MTNHIITINRKSNIEQVSTDDSNFSISIRFLEPPNEIFFWEIVAGMICSEEVLAEPEVLPVITALKNVVRAGEAKPNSSEVLEGGSKVGIKLGSQREDLWRDRDQEKTGGKKLKSKSALALPTSSTNQQTPASLNNLDINKEELDALYEKM
ncbi:4199_t:CDS:2, partial [Gigaspora margarita]